MKKLLRIITTIILLLFITKISYSQRTPLPTDSAQWIYRGFAIGNGDSIFIYRVKGDTILGNKTYSKVYRANDNDTNYYSTNETLYCFIRNDTNRRAYVRYPDNYCNDTSDILLYDYNLNVGDTFNVHLLQPNPGYPCLDTAFEFIVAERIDSAEFFTNYYLSQIRLKILSSQFWCWGNFCPEKSDNNLIWIEEVGTLFHTTFYNEYEIHVCFSPWLTSRFSLCGFWEKGKWLMEDPCIIINVNEEEAINHSNISPNPFTTSTQITLNKTYHNISLSVYDIQGKLMLQKQFADCSQIQLNRNGLNNGMYFLKLTLDEKWVETGKIVVGD